MTGTEVYLLVAACLGWGFSTFAMLQWKRTIRNWFGTIESWRKTIDELATADAANEALQANAEYWRAVAERSESLA